MSSDPNKGEPYQTGWSSRTIFLAIVSAVLSLVISGGVLFVVVQVMESMETPGNRFPDWVAKTIVIIFLGIFIALWKLGFAFLVQRFDPHRT